MLYCACVKNVLYSKSCEILTIQIGMIFELTPILMRSAASTIFRRIMLNVCGLGPPEK